MNRLAKQKPVNQVTHEHLWKWMKLFQECIRNRDVETASTLFHESVIGFDSWSSVALNLQGLQEQWTDQWGNQIQFEFDLKNARIIPAAPIWIVVTYWKARGLLVGSKEREGKATYCLALFESGIKCVHSHVSKV